MATMHRKHLAFGGPGLELRWSGGAKEGVGTAYLGSSRVWFTICGGVLNEVYYPTIDSPQIRDFQSTSVTHPRAGLESNC